MTRPAMFQVWSPGDEIGGLVAVERLRTVRRAVCESPWSDDETLQPQAAWSPRNVDEGPGGQREDFGNLENLGARTVSVIWATATKICQKVIDIDIMIKSFKVYQIFIVFSFGFQKPRGEPHCHSIYIYLYWCTY
jgi:hypothetical protein